MVWGVTIGDKSPGYVDILLSYLFLIVKSIFSWINLYSSSWKANPSLLLSLKIPTPENAEGESRVSTPLYAESKSGYWIAVSSLCSVIPTSTILLWLI